MNTKGILGIFSPRVTSKVISFTLALVITLGSAKVYEALAKKDTLGDGNNGGVTDTGSVSETAKGDGKDHFSDEGAKTLSGEYASDCVLVLDSNKMNIIAEKNKEKVISCGDLSLFAVALLTSRAIDSGRITENEYAVCPASAQKRPGYQLSSAILSVGKRMTVGDILRCMIYQQGAAFAYTLAVHISGSEEAFLSELNALMGDLKTVNTAFASVCGDDDGISKTTVSDATVIIRAFLSDKRLREMLCSGEGLAIKNSEETSSVYLTVKNDFFVSCCTEGQAKADGILGGKVGIVGDEKWAVVLFEKEGAEYLIISVGCRSPYSEALRLFAAFV